MRRWKSRVVSLGAAVLLGALGSAQAQDPWVQPEPQEQEQAKPGEETPAMGEEPGQIGEQRPGHIGRASIAEELELKSFASMSVEDRKAIQEKLKAHGIYDAAIDGVVGVKTKAALKLYLLERFVAEVRKIDQNEVGAETISFLGIEPGELRPVAGEEMEEEEETEEQIQPPVGEEPQHEGTKPKEGTELEVPREEY